MKKFTALLLTFVLLTGNLFQVMASADSLASIGIEGTKKKTVKILLIGNSYTKYNDSGDILSRICKSAGQKANVTTVAQNGAALYMYANKKTRLGRRVRQLLKNQKWDYVVLQDRHFLPLTAPGKTRKAILKLKPYIEASGAKLALFMTWVPALGHQDYEEFDDLITSRKDYQAKIAASCERIAKAVDAIVIPTGISFYNTQKQKTGIRLLDKDKTHPSYAGSYLSACTMYTTLFNDSPRVSYTGELKAKEAKLLQNNARNTVKEYKKEGSKL
ncbi:DUF4886 domain-containing protein [Blautia schinkii]|nr:DUF4886 domain-containing protein [Blautia schinkii]